MPDYFFGGVSAVCVQTRLKTPEIGLAGSVGPRRLVGRVLPVQYDKLSPPLCALGELCTLDRKCLGKTPQICASGAFGCIFDRKYLNNSAVPQYAPECTHGFSPTTMGVRWMAPAGPQTAHRPSARQMTSKICHPAGASREAPPATAHQPHQNDHTGVWGPRRGPGRARRGVGGCPNTPEPPPDTP